MEQNYFTYPCPRRHRGHGRSCPSARPNPERHRRQAQSSARLRRAGGAPRSTSAAGSRAMSVAGFSAQPGIIKRVLDEAVGCDSPAVDTLPDGRMGLTAEMPLDHPIWLPRGRDKCERFCIFVRFPGRPAARSVRRSARASARPAKPTRGGSKSGWQSPSRCSCVQPDQTA